MRGSGLLLLILKMALPFKQVLGIPAILFHVPMKNYMVTYDLNNTGKNYNGLIGAIKAYPYHHKALMSAWFIKTSDTAEAIFSNLWRQMDADDYLYVEEINGNGRIRVMPGAADFL